MGSKFEYVMLYPSQIKIDMIYQRDFRPDWAAHIAKTWDDDVANAPKVSLRDDGNYYVFDGQHTLAAYQKVYGNKPIMCKVYRELSVKRESDLFIKQTGFSHKVDTCSRLRAAYNQGREDVVDMVECARIAGCTIGLDANSRFSGKNRINAIAAAYKVHESVGHDNFINTLIVLKRSFFGEEKAFNDGFLKGMGYLFKHHSNQFTVDKMVIAISKQPVDYYLQLSHKFTGSQTLRNAKAFAAQYNYRKTTGKIQIGD